MSNVKISAGNAKLGSIPSVSLPAGVTCRKDCECFKKCYAQRLERMRPSVRNAYQHNLTLLQKSPDIYWREVEASIMMSRFFRFHVSGDIPNEEYFTRMVEIAKRNPHCEILCFTKKYEIVNEYIKNNGLSSRYVGVVIDMNSFLGGGREVYEDYLDESTAAEKALPKNLHVLFSAWQRLDMPNPFGLPEAHVRSRCGTTTARPDAINCPGNCTTCATTDGGCWVLKRGEQVVFDEH